MANGDEKSENLYLVLGLKKDCTASELRSAYKKLALRWHPDRCSASGTSEFAEEAKTKFQEIQQAYSVLSDVNKRFLYDIGAYDNDDDENGMGDFMSEMAVLMSQTNSNERGQWSFEDLQETFDDMFRREIKTSRFGSQIVDTTTSLSSCVGYYESSTSSKKRGFTAMNSGKKEGGCGFDSHFQNLYPEMKKPRDEGKGKEVREERLDARKRGRKRKVPSGVPLVP
ncbi:chaperone protein DnaJ-like [Rhodamnia argentea]|uniref:Chaperone protein DnaJ-like n=1 Tax=Rhodamnia argentea TaxID=178133 RepID=A0A8B8NQ53_9MYRT|nr:chaperone protein DnaJ-like [Rhodamnia argentea]